MLLGQIVINNILFERNLVGENKIVLLLFIWNSFNKNSPIKIIVSANKSQRRLDYDKIELVLCRKRDFMKDLLKYFKGYIKESLLGPLFKLLEASFELLVPILIATLRGADYMNFDMGKIYTMILVAIVPIIIVYLFLSKYIIAGVTLGGVKE